MNQNQTYLLKRINEQKGSELTKAACLFQNHADLNLAHYTAQGPIWDDDGYDTRNLELLIVHHARLIYGYTKSYYSPPQNLTTAVLINCQFDLSAETKADFSKTQSKFKCYVELCCDEARQFKDCENFSGRYCKELTPQILVPHILNIDCIDVGEKFDIITSYVLRNLGNNNGLGTFQLLREQNMSIYDQCAKTSVNIRKIIKNTAQSKICEVSGIIAQQNYLLQKVEASTLLLEKLLIKLIM